ncbi:hypothetical protein X743_32360 [Mesorhizobium sp. LNHC252B00]|nr:hypothetical protein X743_32360 [Mesorhizobium sp. LNHC252B00]
MVIDEARSLIRQRNEIEAQADDLLRHSQDYRTHPVKTADVRIRRP